MCPTGEVSSPHHLLYHSSPAAAATTAMGTVKRREAWVAHWGWLWCSVVRQMGVVCGGFRSENDVVMPKGYFRCWRFVLRFLRFWRGKLQVLRLRDEEMNESFISS